MLPAGQPPNSFPTLHSAASRTHSGSSRRGLEIGGTTTVGRTQSRGASLFAQQQHIGDFAASVRFARPGGEMGEREMREQEARWVVEEEEKEEDLFDVLQRRIEAQRSELRQHRQSIQEAVSRPNECHVPFIDTHAVRSHSNHNFLIPGTSVGVDVVQSRLYGTCRENTANCMISGQRDTVA